MTPPGALQPCPASVREAFLPLSSTLHERQMGAFSSSFLCMLPFVSIFELVLNIRFMIASRWLWFSQSGLEGSMANANSTFYVQSAGMPRAQHACEHPRDNASA